MFGRRADDRLPPSSDSTSHYLLLSEAMATERPDLDVLAMHLGIEMVDAEMRSDLCGWMEQTADGWRVTRNAGHKPTRRRFTTAHMIGHHFLHRDLMMKRGPNPGGTNDGTNYRRVAGAPFDNPAITPEYDTQANKFAVQLIMPTPIVTALHDEGQTVFQIAARLEVAVQAMAIRLRGIAEPA